MSEPNIRPLSKELQARACKELNEDPKRRAADIAHIREWLKKQPHILGNPDDQTIIAFLRGCKFSLERTKEKLDMYYTVRTALPEFFKDRDLKNNQLREILELGTFIVTPGTDDNGRRVMMGRFGPWDPAIHNMDLFFKMNVMMMEVMIREDDEAIINGSVGVMDLKGMTLAHATQMGPAMMKKMMIIFQDAFPFRPKGFNYINNPSVFEPIFSVIKLFAKDKLKNRLFIHGSNMESLYKNIPQKYLAKEYGGQAGTLDELSAAWTKKVLSYQDWFLSDEGTLGVDETKRPGKPKTYQDIFGIEGSFRQLNVD